MAFVAVPTASWYSLFAPVVSPSILPSSKRHQLRKYQASESLLSCSSASLKNFTAAFQRLTPFCHCAIALQPARKVSVGETQIFEPFGRGIRRQGALLASDILFNLRPYSQICLSSLLAMSWLSPSAAHCRTTVGMRR